MRSRRVAGGQFFPGEEGKAELSGGTEKRLGFERIILIQKTEAAAEEGNLGVEAGEAGGEEDMRRVLRQHGFGVVAVGTGITVARLTAFVTLGTGHKQTS